MYALVTVMDENDLGSGPMMKHREVNLHDIDEDFMDKFIAGVDRHGLQNTLLANAMDVSVHKEDVNLDSLLPTQSTAFTNHVVWQPSITKSKSSQPSETTVSTTCTTSPNGSRHITNTKRQRRCLQQVQWKQRDRKSVV